MQTIVENLYVVQNGDGTIDTVMGDPSEVFGLMDAMEFCHPGGSGQVTQISCIAGLELDSSALEFDYVISNN